MHPLVELSTTATTAALEVSAGRMTQAAADRLAALTARGASARQRDDPSHRRLRHAADRRPRVTRRIPAAAAGPDVDHPGRAGRALPVPGGDLRPGGRPPHPADAPARVVGVRAYAGFPVRDPAGDVVGVCAVMDYVPREWHAARAGRRRRRRAGVHRLRGRAAGPRRRARTAPLPGRAAQQPRHRGRRLRPHRAAGAGQPAALPTGSASDLQGSDIEQWTARTRATDADGTPVTTAQTPLAHALHGRRLHGVEQTLRHHGRRFAAVPGQRPPVTDERGRRLGAVSVFHDITEAAPGRRPAAGAGPDQGRVPQPRRTRAAHAADRDRLVPGPDRRRRPGARRWPTAWRWCSPPGAAATGCAAWSRPCSTSPRWTAGAPSCDLPTST